jgi:hypothetical protein
MLAEPVLDFANTHFVPMPPELRFEIRFSRLASLATKKNGTIRVGREVGRGGGRPSARADELDAFGVLGLAVPDLERRVGREAVARG